jgi:ppGpp synthetase/RelA/SpoT-type nucleotidyltranferase
MRLYNKGGQSDFNPDGNIKGKVVHASGDAGGMLVGNRHSQGGIKALNKSTNQPIEMEGGEVVITRNAVSDNKKRSFNGKMMTNRQILSTINESGGGVSFAEGGELPKDVSFDCNAEYEYGGRFMCGKDLAFAMGGDVYAKGGKVEDDEWKSIVSKFLNEFYGDYEDDTWEDYVDSDSVESIQTKYKKTSGRYDREVSFEEAYQTFKSSLTPKELKSIEVSFDEGEYADAEEHDEDKNWNSITIRKVGTYAKGGTIECGSCDWSWDRKDGGDDMYVCHKCGTDNTDSYAKGGAVDDDFSELTSAVQQMNEIMEEGGETFKAPKYYTDLLEILPLESGTGKDKISLFEDYNTEIAIQFGKTKPQYLGRETDTTIIESFFNLDSPPIDKIVIQGDSYRIREVEEEFFSLLGLIKFFENTDLEGTWKFIFYSGFDEINNRFSVTGKKRKPTGWRKTYSFGQKDIKKDLYNFLDIFRKKKLNDEDNFNLTNFVVGKLSEKSKNNELRKKFIDTYSVVNDTVQAIIMKDPTKISERFTFKGENFVARGEQGTDSWEIYPKDESAFKLLQKLNLIEKIAFPTVVEPKDLSSPLKSYDKLIESVSKELKLKSPLLTNEEIAIYQRRISNLINNQRKLQQEINDTIPFLQRVNNGLNSDFGNINNKYTPTKLISINGKRSELTDEEYRLVRTQEFKTFFGDWELAYETGDYDICSKVINEKTKEPLAVFHGTDTMFSEFKTYETNQLHYFAKKREMANFFATSWKQRTDKSATDSSTLKQLNPMKGEFIYRNFLDIRNPIDFSRFGVEKRPIKDFLKFLEINYNISGFDFLTTASKFGDKFLDREVYAWVIIRTWQDFNTYIKTFTQYDGYVFYEFIPDISPSKRDGLNSASLSFCAFESNQIKLANANKFNSLVSDIRFEKGGRTISIVNDGVKFDKSKYKAIYGDYDKDGTVNIDDANPLDASKNNTVEQVELKDTFDNLLSVKAELDDVMYDAVDTLDKKAPKNADIYARTKTPYSILKKLVEKRMLDPEKGLTDMVGTTIAVENQKELEQVRDDIDGGLLGKILDRDDYYKSPKAGYKAYHYIVEYQGIPVEVQLKTKTQKKLHEISHESYKKGNLNPKGLEKMSDLFEKSDRGDALSKKKVNKLIKNKKQLTKNITT